MEKESLGFESKEAYKGFTVKSWYLKEPNYGDALIEIFKDGQLHRFFKFPAYKIWNIAAHFHDIVEGEIANSTRGYKMAAWNGISVIINLEKEDSET